MGNLFQVPLARASHENLFVTEFYEGCCLHALEPNEN